MKIEDFLNIVGSDFYTGVPDSQLKALCNYLMHTYGIDPEHHIIAANEGNSVALAAGYHLATGKTAMVYLQNSGEGNIINPLTSLLNEKVYAIPAIFVIGWRGEPGQHDEPQHICQGAITAEILEVLGVDYFILDKETSKEEISRVMIEFNKLLEKGKSVAFIVRREALTYEQKVNYHNLHVMKREEIIGHIVAVSGDDPIISTTGKTSRELFEIRDMKMQGHQRDFLTVGSMGHTSSIALGIAINKPNTKIWCVDGDGAALMHMGSMALLGSLKPQNLVHILINNAAHETVGGMPTVADDIDFTSVAKACGYPSALCVTNFSELNQALIAAKNQKTLSFIEVKCAIGSREDLGRPSGSAIENKACFMEYLSSM